MNLKEKILTKPALSKALRRLKAQGRTIAFTNGCFDIIHAGHVHYLEKAKSRDRILIVGLNSDRSVSRIKGPQRPIVPERDRACVLAALTCVDYVILFSEEDPYQLIKWVQPDVLIKGADWKGKDVVGRDLVEKAGGRVEFVAYQKGRSTTNIIDRIRAAYA